MGVDEFGVGMAMQQLSVQGVFLSVVMGSGGFLRLSKVGASIARMCPVLSTYLAKFLGSLIRSGLWVTASSKNKTRAVSTEHPALWAPQHCKTSSKLFLKCRARAGNEQ